jgi:acetoin utilization protein AcuB
MAMKVRDFMASELITVDVKTTILEAQDIMRQNHIKRLPVMKKGKMVGLVTKNMLLEATPSTATSLSIHELNYILSKMTVADVMVKDPKTIPSDYPVEAAIWLGRKHGIGAFPVVDEEQLVGIITESDITHVLLEVLGLESEGIRVTIEEMGNRYGELRDIIDVLDSHKAPLLSMISIPRKKRDDWVVVLRIQGTKAEPIVKDLEKKGFKITDVN